MRKSCSWFLLVSGFLFLAFAVSRFTGADAPAAAEAKVDANRLRKSRRRCSSS